MNMKLSRRDALRFGLMSVGGLALSASEAYAHTRQDDADALFPIRLKFAGGSCVKTLGGGHDFITPCVFAVKTSGAPGTAGFKQSIYQSRMPTIETNDGGDLQHFEGKNWLLLPGQTLKRDETYEVDVFLYGKSQGDIVDFFKRIALPAVIGVLGAAGLQVLTNITGTAKDPVGVLRDILTLYTTQTMSPDRVLFWAKETASNGSAIFEVMKKVYEQGAKKEVIIGSLRIFIRYKYGRWEYIYDTRESVNSVYQFVPGPAFWPHYDGDITQFNLKGRPGDKDRPHYVIGLKPVSAYWDKDGNKRLVSQATVYEPIAFPGEPN